MSFKKALSDSVSVPLNPEADAEELTEEFYVLPEEALRFLPSEWQADLAAQMDGGRAVLRSVDNELAQLARLSISSLNLVQLKHVDKRLREYKFAANMEAFLELEMLTTAFVVIYARLHQGSSGSGFSKGALPEILRSHHDQIIEMRNKRFAHSAGHHSVADAMEIHFDGDQFAIHPSLTIGYHIGGANEWHELVDVVEQLVVDRMSRLLTRLRAKTGFEWSYPIGPAPE